MIDITLDQILPSSGITENIENTRTPNEHNYAKTPPKQKKELKIIELKAIYNCRCCGYRTMNRELLSRHPCPKQNIDTKKNSQHNKNTDGYLHCKKCSYFNKSKTNLKIHMNIHTKGNPYKCTECDFAGEDLKKLLKHYEVTKDLVCECGYTTHFKQQMVVHKRVHTVKNLYRR